MRMDSSKKVDDIDLPVDLVEKTYTQFDDMVLKGRIFHDHQTEPGELFVHEGFQFEFRIVSFLKGKPVLAPDDPGRSNTPIPLPTRTSTPTLASSSSSSQSPPPLSSSPGQRGGSRATVEEVRTGPFIAPKPDEIIINSFGPRHRLMLNKYCIYRPMLVLPTKEFALQSDDLDASDLAASWSLLQTYSSSFDPLIIYNRGVNGGSSQGHKHLQLFPIPPKDPFFNGADLWPAKASSTEIVATDIPNVPFKHFVLRIPQDASINTLVAMHDHLLHLTRNAHIDADQSPDGDYNVAIAKSWIALIPRTTAGPPNGPFGTSTVGMLGLVAIRDAEDRRKWEEFGYTRFLTKLGIPI